MNRYDVARIPLIRDLLESRWPQFILRVITLAGFIFLIMAGFIGTPVGNKNSGIVLVWIAWWAMLILLAVPILGRGWCSICPIPMPGEWLQNGALLGPNGKNILSGLRRRWPKALRNIWLQNITFTLLAVFSVVILTQPRVTAILLASFLFIALGTSLIYERRAFCRYLCPVGGFIGLYSQISPVEVRVRDTAICAAHTPKTCYTGDENGYGCPWGVFPGGLKKNTYCGTCMECLRVCPHDNIAFNLRKPGTDLKHSRGRRLDEVAKAFIMLGAAFIYSTVLLGPWSELKAAAYSVGSASWLGYVLGFLVFVFGILPGLFLLVTIASRKLTPAMKNRSLRRTFISLAYALIPLGLAAWIAFSISFVFVNFSYVWNTLTDPMGWGWNLLGLTSRIWTPYLTGMIPVVQIVVLLTGMAGSIGTARNIVSEGNPSRTSNLTMLPVVLYSLLLTIGLLWLLVG
jgi:ferredoxin